MEKELAMLSIISILLLLVLLSLCIDELSSTTILPTLVALCTISRSSPEPMFETSPFGELIEEDFEPITDLRDDENLFVRGISFF